MQKLLIACNSLPQPHYWPLLQQSNDTDLKSAQNHTTTQLKRLSTSLKGLMSQFFENDACLFSKRNKDGDDEDQSISSGSEITSDTDDCSAHGSNDEDDDSDVSSTAPSHSAAIKRKREKNDDLCPSETLKRIRDEVMDEWYHKTRYSTTNANKGSEAAEQLPSLQIRQIMSDEKRLLRRSQLRRSQIQVIGKTENQEDETRKQQNCDPECFDDDDFYHQLLREVIDSKTAGSTDCMAVSRKWLEIQQLRSRMKKKVDTKASKGRKIRDQIHKQLLNFMAPIHTYEMTEGAKDELFSSLFL